jgi:hypothetical protein
MNGNILVATIELGNGWGVLVVRTISFASSLSQILDWHNWVMRSVLLDTFRLLVLLVKA